MELSSTERRAIIIDNYAKLGPQAVAEMTGMTTRQVTRKASKLGISMPGRWSTAKSMLPFKLTRAELEVLRELARGHSRPRIAADLGISETAVWDRLGRAYMRMGVANAVQAVLKAERAGLLADVK